MKKKIILLVCVVLAAAMIFGACASGTPESSASPSASGDEPASDTVIVGEIDGQPVYKSEFEEWLNLNGYGTQILEDESNSEYVAEFLDYFLEEKVMDAEIKNRGYVTNLTSDQIAQAEQNAQDDIDYMEQNYGMTEEEILETIGITKEELIDQYKLKMAGNAAYTELVGDLKPAEDQIKQEYDSTVAAQKEAMDADPAAYVSDVISGMDVYYAPAGVRMVRKLLIAIDAETADAITILRDSGFDKQADILLNNALSSIKPKAEEAAKKIKSGLSFSEALQQYNQDTDASESGYPVVAGTKDYTDTFIEKAMALKSPGEISGIFASDEGYLIIEYSSDVTPGAAEYESVKDRISDSLLVQVQGDAWAALIDQWKKDHNVKTFVDNL